MLHQAQKETMQEEATNNTPESVAKALESIMQPSQLKDLRRKVVTLYLMLKSTELENFNGFHYAVDCYNQQYLKRSGAGCFMALSRHKNGRSQLTKVCCGLMHTIGAAEQPNRTFHHTKKLLATKDSVQTAEEKVGAFTKMIEALGFTGPLKYNKWKIKIAALRMYTCCVEKTDYEEFFNKFQMPDTLNSWFLIAQLHVWMCLVRMKQEGRAGKYMCRYIVHSMWEDVEQRGKVMGIDSVALKESLKNMTENFYAAIFGYDEGILSDDHVLAAAIWRNMFNKQCDDPRLLEIMVEYVRRQVQHLDAIPGEDLLLSGEITWRPLVETNAQSIVKPASPTYNDEGL